MRIRWTDRFEDDYERLQFRLNNRKAFRKAFVGAVSILQKGDDLSVKYTVNRMVNRGPGWYVCYVMDDIAMTYKIVGQYIKLSRIGLIKDLGKEK